MLKRQLFLILNHNLAYLYEEENVTIKNFWNTCKHAHAPIQFSIENFLIDSVMYNKAENILVINTNIV